MEPKRNPSSTPQSMPKTVDRFERDLQNLLVRQFSVLSSSLSDLETKLDTCNLELRNLRGGYQAVEVLVRSVRELSSRVQRLEQLQQTNAQTKTTLSSSQPGSWESGGDDAI